MDARKNFAITTVATAPSPATSGTSLVVAAGAGAKFPAAPFNAVIWPTGANPTDANAEVVRVTAKSTDTFTIVRAQESSSARTVIVGDQIMQAATDKTFLDIETALKTGWFEVRDTWSYASWDSTNKVGTITVPTDATGTYSAGMRIKITQSTGGTKYGIITKVTATILTVFFGTDYTLNNEAISSPYYANVKAPKDFPLAPEKWTLKFVATADITQSSPTGNTWYALTGYTLAVPIGAWDLTYEGVFAVNSTASQTAIRLTVTLSKSSATEDDIELSVYQGITGPSGNHLILASVSKTKRVLHTADTTYYLNWRTVSSTGVVASLLTAYASQPAIIRATCAYL